MITRHKGGIPPLKTFSVRLHDHRVCNINYFIENVESRQYEISKNQFNQKKELDKSS